MKTCKTCGVEKPLTEFNKHPHTRDRLQQYCKICHRAQSMSYYAANSQRAKENNRRSYYENRESRLAASRAWYQANKDKSNASARARYANNPGPMREATRRWERANPEKRRARARRFSEANPSRLTEYTARKRAEKSAMPAWANRFFVQEAYALAKLRTKIFNTLWTVDHIVPLHSPIVCGLHVENNLRVIPHKHNASKGNRLWPDMPHKEVVNG